MQCSRSTAENFDSPDIVLVQAPGWGVNTPPLGMAMLTAFARKQGYKVLPLDLNIETYIRRTKDFASAWDGEQAAWFWETGGCIDNLMKTFKSEIGAFIELIIQTNAPIVGFTIYSSSQQVSLELARMLKERNPAIKIIFGGANVSRYMGGLEIAKTPYVDAVAQGEGELTLIDIVDRIKNGRSIKDCPGLVDTEDRELVDLNELPPPDFSDYEFGVYRYPNRLPMQGSRGCPNRCIFCNERPYWRTYRFRKAEKIFEDIKTLLARYPDGNLIDFQDSLINGSMRDLELLADLILEHDLNIYWGGQTVIRKEMANVELLKKLKRSGFLCGAYGIETASVPLMVKVGKILARGSDVDEIAEAHTEAGLDHVYNFMFGLPGETEEDAFANHEFIRRHAGSITSVNPSPGFCGIGPGSLAWENPGLYNLDLSRGTQHWKSTDGKNTWITRLKRFEDFCMLAAGLGIPIVYNSTKLLDRNRALGKYYAMTGDTQKASWYYKAWLAEHPEDSDALKALDYASG